MKFAFVYPTGIFTEERNLTYLHSFEHEGIKFFFFDRNIYFCRKTGKIKAEKVNLDNYTTSYYNFFAEFDGYLFYLCQLANKSIQECENWLKERISQIHIWNKEYSEKLKDIPKHNEECQKELEQKRIQREEEDRLEQIAKEKREEENRRKIEAEIESNILKYKNGEMIGWSFFEDICAKYGILIPIQTLGAARKRIIEINKERRIRFSGNKPLNSLAIYVNKLNEILV